MQTESTKKNEAKKNGAAKAKPKKEEAPSKPTTAKEPVRLVRELWAEMKGAKRREVIAAAVAKGVNRWTASTQYQLFHNPPKKKVAK